jgi:xanthine dehydrogenase molybdopterin-binding subunit B
VEVNLLTGERRVLRADVLHDAGRSISPAVDMGQVGAPR